MPQSTKTHLVIPDTHAHPDYPNDRFTWLGKFIMDLRPDAIIHLGDFEDMPSLSSYDKGKKSFEGRRFLLDVASGVDAQEKMFGPLKAHNEARRRLKEKQYKPLRVLLGGNHTEGRINKVVQSNPELSGFLDLAHFRYPEFWDTYVPYKVPYTLDGVSYCHHFPSGPMGQPISGVNLGRTLLQKNHASSTVGHDHRLSVATEVTSTGERMWGVSAGCYFDFTPDYARDTAKEWWRGVLVKRHVHDGDYDLETVSLDVLRRAYA